jgi:biotin transport system substrate-specific component
MMHMELLQSYDRRLVWIGDTAVVLGAAYLLALSAQARLVLPFSPVPVTAQTLVVLVIAALMGRRRALASVGAYLAAGMAGLPFFAGGAFWGPTGGYLLGFGVATYLVASLIGRDLRRRTARVGAGRVIATLFAGNAMIYLVGLPWLAAFVGLRAALPLGFFPFIAGDLAKLTCSAGIVLAWDQLQTKGD